MRLAKKDINRLFKTKRSRHDHIVHKLHKKHRLSYRTLFYMKEYGPHSHIATVIVKESIKVLLVASLLSSIGGLALKGVQDQLIAILPLLVLLPALATLIGSFGTIVASKFTTMLFMKKINRKWWKSVEVRSLVNNIVAIALIASVYIGALAYIIALAKGFIFSHLLFVKVLAISFVATVSLVGIILLISITCSIWIFGKKEDPNNFIIPITTSVADLGSIVLFSALVTMMF